VRLLPLLVILLLGCDVASRPVLPIVDEPSTTQPPATPAPSNELVGRVIAISDGDTLDILTADKQTLRVRLNGIDAPERGQPFGNNAKQLLGDAVFGRDVLVIDHGRDKYGRLLGDVMIDGKSVNLALVAAGLAWHYVQYSSDETLAAAQRDAQRDRRGLWSDARHVAPWDWRKLSKVERDKLR
jgi:micrococcal nuclease